MTASPMAMNKISRRLIFFVTLVCSFVFTNAQVTAPADSSLKLVEFLNSDRQGYKRIDSVNEFNFFVGHVQIRQGNTLFYCDSAVYNRNARIIEAFGNVHINDHDSINTYSQYLLYHVDTRIANLRKKVKLTDGKTSLFSEEVQYDVNQKIGEYHTGGRVENASSVLTSKEAVYYADLKDVYFKQDVNLKDPKYKLKTDSLIYNTSTEIATFIAQTYIEDSAKRKIRTREGNYDLKNKKAVFTSRTTIEDGAVTVKGDRMSTNDSTGERLVEGNAVYTDTAQGVSVLAGRILANGKEGNFLASLHPLMIIKQDADSIYITADTLFSGRLSRMKNGIDSLHLTDTIKGKVVVNATPASDNDSADRYFQAYRHVRIFSDSLQAVSDSLFYSGKDSIFQLFQDPVVWSNQNQVTGDTIYLYTKNKKADRLFVFENGLMINKSHETLFNQIRGNRLNGYFVEGVIDNIRARGNAESIYYIEDDDKKLVGVNKANGDIIDMRFLNKELHRVVFINDVKGVMYPLSQFPLAERELRGFKWREDIRPKTKFELFGD